MKIGLTYDLKTDWQKQDTDPVDISAEFDKPETVDAVVDALEQYDHQVHRIGNVFSLIRQIASLDVDIVFNLCEGRKGRNRESLVPNLLEAYGIPFIGADALTLGVTLDKVIAKQIFKAAGIPTAAYFIATAESDLEQLNTIGYPLIVKTRHEGSSKGIHKEARVENLEQLKERVQFITSHYHQDALVEEFICGRECTVPVLGNRFPQAMPPVQVSIDGALELGDKFYTNDLIYSSSLKYVCPAQFSDALIKKIRYLAEDVFECVECRDWGRVDFRIDEKENPFVLEINPLPALDLDDCFNIFPQFFGLDHAAVINIIVDLGLSRNNIISKSEKDILKPFAHEPARL